MEHTCADCRLPAQAQRTIGGVRAWRCDACARIATAEAALAPVRCESCGHPTPQGSLIAYWRWRICPSCAANLRKEVF